MAEAPTAKADLRLHEAIEGKNVNQIKALVAGGLRPIYLDEMGRSPLDAVDEMDTDQKTRLELRQTLLQSKNSSAPNGYVKPEAFHGSPWGLEILVSGELRGGVNDPKGGGESLEGKVFFSDRTAASDKDNFTRTDLRRNARIYSRGEGLKSTAATSRASQHRLVQAMLQRIAEGRPLDVTGKQVVITCARAEDMQRKVQDHLQERFFFAKAFLLIQLMESATTALSEMADAIKLPTSLVLNVEGRAPQEITGDALVDAYRTAAAQLKVTLEGGKAPFLALLNQGRIVPVVFGFERISELKRHTISGSSPANPPKNYSYQSQNHPLAGSPRGGRLKEIEVASLPDLATLYFGAMVKGVQIPSDVLIRVKPRGRNAGQATYLTADQLQTFHDRLVQTARSFGIPGNGDQDLMSRLPIEKLQALNQHLRNQPLESWVPPRTSSG
jgi:hypothetical protein